MPSYQTGLYRSNNPATRIVRSPKEFERNLVAAPVKCVSRPIIFSLPERDDEDRSPPLAPVPCNPAMPIYWLVDAVMVVSLPWSRPSVDRAVCVAVPKVVEASLNFRLEWEATVDAVANSTPLLTVVCSTMLLFWERLLESLEIPLPSQLTSPVSGETE